MPHYTALVTVLTVLLYSYTVLLVGRARPKFKVPAPAMSGHPEFDRIFRVQMNTLEWMPIFLPLLWLFAFYVIDIAAAALGLVWIAARMLYVVRYAEAAGRRGLGFTLQGAVCVVLFVGAVAGIANSFAHGG